MALGTMYVMTAVNLFCGDTDPTKSKHLTLDELALPALEEEFADHKPGGSLVGIEIGVGIAKLAASFKLKGFDPDLLVQFGLNSPIRHAFTAYGVITDRRTGRQIEARSVMEARLGRNAMDAFKRGDLIGHDYALNEIMHYEFYFDGSEKIYWDFFENAWRVNGIDQNAQRNAILRVGQGVS